MIRRLLDRLAAVPSDGTDPARRLPLIGLQCRGLAARRAATVGFRAR